MTDIPETGRRFEVEVTEEMIVAGVNAVDDMDYYLLTPHEKIALIWKAMVSAAPDNGIPPPLDDPS